MHFPLFFFFFWDSYHLNASWMLVQMIRTQLMYLQRSLNLSSIKKIFSPLLLSILVHFNYYLLSFVNVFVWSSNLLLIPSNIFFISIIVLFSSVWFFFIFTVCKKSLFCFFILFLSSLSILMIIAFNYLLIR